jgi:hypothetical protein
MQVTEKGQVTIPGSEVAELVTHIRSFVEVMDLGGL